MGRARKRGSRPNGAVLPPRAKRVPDSPLDRAKGYEVIWPQVSELFDMARGIRDIQFVYFIGEEDGGPVKIGLAKDPIARLRSMQTGNPRRLKVEYVLMGCMDTEKLLHELWERFAVKSAGTRGKVDAPSGTEWFTPEIREELFPIIATAVEQQIEYVLECFEADEPMLTAAQMDKIVREAHVAHHFAFPPPREQVRLLASGGGYVILGRRTRV